MEPLTVAEKIGRAYLEILALLERKRLKATHTPEAGTQGGSEPPADPVDEGADHPL